MTPSTSDSLPIFDTQDGWRLISSERTHPGGSPFQHVADDGKGANSVLVSELINNLNAQAGAETAFNKTRVAISRASEGEQVPSVSSSLLEDIKLGG